MSPTSSPSRAESWTAGRTRTGRSSTRLDIAASLGRVICRRRRAVIGTNTANQVATSPAKINELGTPPPPGRSGVTGTTHRTRCPDGAPDGTHGNHHGATGRGDAPTPDPVQGAPDQPGQAAPARA